MMIVHRIAVTAVKSEPPNVRVQGYFIEGGNPSKTAVRTQISFLVAQHQQPRVGEDMALAILGPVPHDVSLNDFIGKELFDGSR